MQKEDKYLRQLEHLIVEIYSLMHHLHLQMTTPLPVTQAPHPKQGQKIVLALQSLAVN